MANYFQGTINTLQKFIADERQQRQIKQSPQYQLALQKLMMQKEAHVRQQQALAEFQETGDVGKFAQTMGDLDYFLNKQRADSFSAGQKSLIEQREQKVIESQKNVDLKNAQIEHEKALTEKAKKYVPTTNNKNKPDPTTTLFGQTAKDYEMSINRFSPISTNVVNKDGVKTDEKKFVFRNTTEKREHEHAAALKQMHDLGLREKHRRQLGYSKATMVREFRTMQENLGIPANHASAMMKNGLNLRGVQKLINNLKRTNPQLAKLDNTRLLRIAIANMQ